MRRRELLRLLAVAGLAGCTTGFDEESVGVPVVEARPVARSEPTATPSSGSPSPSRTPDPVPTPDPAPAPDPSPTPDPTPATDATVSEPSTPSAPEPESSSEPPPPPEPEPAPAPEPAPTAGERVVVAVGRDTLGLPVPRPGGRSHSITGLALHHTANPTAPASAAPARFRSITEAHRDQGWVDAAYHWGVAVDGTVYELRDEAIAGDTNTGYDPAGWFLVVCEGNFEESEPPQAMLDAVADVFADAVRRHGVAPSTLRGHRDLAATLCPGARLQARLGDVRRAVAARVEAGGVRLVVG